MLRIRLVLTLERMVVRVRLDWQLDADAHSVERGVGRGTERSRLFEMDEGDGGLRSSAGLRISVPVVVQPPA